jgi:hypothetical protein
MILILRASFIVRRDHAPFGGGHVLGGVETETGERAQRSDLPAVKYAFDGVGSVFDHEQVVFLAIAVMASISRGDQRNAPARWLGFLG